MCQGVRVLAGGYTSHHASPTIIQMRLPNGEMATNDAENASVFGPHFDRVSNNHSTIDWHVIDKIKQIDMMEKLDPPISWDKKNYPPESFQLQMGFSFPLLRANDLRSSLLNIRAPSFLLSCM